MASSLISVLTVTTPSAPTRHHRRSPTVNDGGLLDAAEPCSRTRAIRAECGIHWPRCWRSRSARSWPVRSSFAAITDWLYDLDEAAQQRLGFTRGVPAGTTVWRLLIRLDATLLSKRPGRLAAHPDATGDRSGRAATGR